MTFTDFSWRVIIVPNILSIFEINGINHLILSCLVENLIYWWLFGFFNDVIKNEISMYIGFALIIIMSIILISLKNNEMNAKLYES